jgi:phosphoglycerate dehydrogenase-like enzyme
VTLIEVTPSVRLRCAVIDDYQSVAFRVADWSRLAPEVDITSFAEHVTDLERLAQMLAPFDIVVAMRERTAFSHALFSRLPVLKLLVTTGMTNAAIDLDAAADRSVLVCGTGGTAHGTPELTWALLLSLVRHLPEETAALRAGGPWQSTLGMELAGKVLGLVGLGRIGGKVARIAQAFGMQVLAWSSNLTDARCDELRVTRAGSLEELLEASHVVSVHLILSKRTCGLIGRSGLRRMSPRAYLINTSRGAIVEERALIEALRKGWIAGAGIDVFDAEPLPPDHPFRNLPNVVATPHLGAVTTECYEVFYREAVEDIQAWLNGSPIRVVHPS